jgi:hypothetical protein
MVFFTNAYRVKVVRAAERIRYHLLQIHSALAPPEAVMLDLIMGGWVAQAIAAAADLGIADALATKPMSADELAAKTHVDVDCVSRLLRALIGRGIFDQRRDGRYVLTPLAIILCRDAELSVAAWARWVGSPQHREHWSHLTDAIRTGRAVIPALRGTPEFEYLSGEPELAEIFNAAMTNIAELSISPVTAAYDFGSYQTVVDVGGGHGRLLAAILNVSPKTHGVLFDLPHVIAGAPALLQRYHVEHRVRLEQGSFFDAVPEGGDAYLLKNVIHDWPDEDAVRILSNVRAATKLGAKLLLIELVIPGNSRDFLGKWVDLDMLIIAGARERTSADYDQLLDRSGFRMTRVVDTASPFSLIEASAIST